MEVRQKIDNKNCNCLPLFKKMKTFLNALTIECSHSREQIKIIANFCWMVGQDRGGLLHDRHKMTDYGTLLEDRPNFVKMTDKG